MAESNEPDIEEGAIESESVTPSPDTDAILEDHGPSPSPSPSPPHEFLQIGQEVDDDAAPILLVAPIPLDDEAIDSAQAKVDQIDGGDDVIGPVGPSAIDTESTAEQEPSNIETRTSSASGPSVENGLEQIYDDDGPPPLFSMTGESNIQAVAPPPAGVEQIDDTGPPPINNDKDDARDMHVRFKSKVHLIDDEDPPPLLLQNEEDEKLLEERTMNAQTTTVPVNNASNSIDQGGMQDEEEAVITFTPYTPVNTRSTQHVELSAEEDAAPNIGQPIPLEESTTVVQNIDGSNANNRADGENGLPLIPEAYPVTEGDLVFAEPAVPWYKQGRTKALSSLICLLTIAAAIGIAVRPQPTAETLIVTNTASPSISTAPSPLSSHIPSAVPSPLFSAAPSMSSMPSAAPTSCAFKISSGEKRLDMLHEDPYSPRVVMDGRNAVVVAHGSNANGAFNVEFFSLTDQGWERGSVFVEKEFDQYYTGGAYSSSISGDTALVGLYDTKTGAGAEAGVVHVYRRDPELGIWEKDENPLTPNDGGTGGAKFGWSVDIDSDSNFACVAAPIEGAVYVFIQTRGKWIQVDKVILGQFVAWECLIAGKTLAVQPFDWQTDKFEDLRLYNYNEEFNKFILLQDPIPANRFKVMNNNYLIFSTGSTSESGGLVYDGVHIYHRQDEGDQFTLLQFLNSSEYDFMFGAQLAMDLDTLAVYAFNTTIMFSERSGIWEEALVLDRSYMSYQLSGRHMLTTGFYRVLHDGGDPTFHHEVYALNVEDCTQSIPTQLPSISLSPTVFVPCYQVDISVTFGFSPGSTGWYITKLSATGDDTVVKSYEGAWTDLSQSRSWSVCLPEAEYQFTIYNNEGDGLCCGIPGNGGYNVTFDERIVAEGGEFEFNETSLMPIPYFPAPSAMPSSSAPSLSPTLSISPTETCYWIEIRINADSYPHETQWSISKVSRVDGIEEDTIIYDNRPTIILQASGMPFDAAHIGNSAINTNVTAVLCDCGLGATQCECRGQTCLMERGDNMFYEKVANCEYSGGLAAIIYNNGGEVSTGWTLDPGSSSIPAVFISQEDGQYLLEYGLGEISSVAVYDQPLPIEANVLNSHRMCLEESLYRFVVYDSAGDGLYPNGGYSIASGGEIILQGAEFSSNETTLFNIPFTGSAKETNPPTSSGRLRTQQPSASPMTNVPLMSSASPSNSSISGHAFFDLYNSGENVITDSRNHGVNSVSISLFNCNDEVLKSTETNAAGFYSFGRLEGGQYYIKVEPSQLYSFSEVWNGKADENGGLLYPNVDNVVDPSTGSTACFDLDESEDASVSVGLKINFFAP